MTRPRNSARRRWLAVAAGAVIVSLAAAGSMLVRLDLFTTFEWLSPDYIRTGIGEQRSIALNDGSVVQINTNSELTINLIPHQRHIKLLRGEARFTVAKDPERPFVVTTPHASVRALGTVFNVRIEPTQTAVAVLEGRVEVTDRSNARPSSQEETYRGSESAAARPHLILYVGERAAVTDTGELLANEGPPFELVSVWTEHRLVFRDQPLAKLVAEVNRYHRAQIRIADADLAGHQINMDADAYDRASVIEYLRRFEDVRVEMTPDGTQVLSWPKPAAF